MSRPHSGIFADNCKYLATSDPDGFHYARLHLDAMVPYEAFREGALDPVDIEVGGHPAFTASDLDPRGWLNTQVLVDLGDESLRVTLIADDGVDPDQMASTIRLAETAVGKLGSLDPQATIAPAETAAEATGLALPDVDGIRWQGEIKANGAEIAEMADAGLNLPFEVLLEQLGAEISQLGFQTANAIDAETGAQLGSYLAVRVEGVDATSLEPAAIAWLTGLVGAAGVSVETTELGGRDVVLIGVGPGSEAYVYVSDDTAHLMALPGSTAARLLETLP